MRCSSSCILGLTFIERVRMFENARALRLMTEAKAREARAARAAEHQQRLEEKYLSGAVTSHQQSSDGAAGPSAMYPKARVPSMRSRPKPTMPLRLSLSVLCRLLPYLSFHSRFFFQEHAFEDEPSTAGLPTLSGHHRSTHCNARDWVGCAQFRGQQYDIDDACSVLCCRCAVDFPSLCDGCGLDGLMTLILRA